MRDEEDHTGRDPQARSSVDVDTIWNTRQSTIWDMRHDPEGGKEGWDFSKSQDRNRARRKMNKLKPMLIIGNRMETVLQNFEQEDLDRMSEYTQQQIKNMIAEHAEFITGIYRT